MMVRCAAIAIVAGVVALSGCAPPERTTALENIDVSEGYRYRLIDDAVPSRDDAAFVATTFSGGGMRAAALSYGVLKALKETELEVAGRETNLLSQVDLVSSVSGGSVTAAYWALEGPDGLDVLEEEFLRRNVNRDLLLRLLHPGVLLLLPTESLSRIDILKEYLDDVLFEFSRYEDLVSGAESGGDRPFLVLNATDMATGLTFPFTQRQFDRLCADLSRFTVAEAVAASAAYPGVFTALTLKNFNSVSAPCKPGALGSNGTEDLNALHRKFQAELKEGRMRLSGAQRLLREAEDGLIRAQRTSEAAEREHEKAEQELLVADEEQAEAESSVASIENGLGELWTGIQNGLCCFPL